MCWLITTFYSRNRGTRKISQKPSEYKWSTNEALPWNFGGDISVLHRTEKLSENNFPNAKWQEKEMCGEDHKHSPEKYNNLLFLIISHSH